MAKLIVTGGANGIGLGVARAYASADWNVAIVDRDAEALESVAAEIGATAVVADVTDRDGLEAAFADVAAGEPIAGLVTCAGVTRIGPSAELSARDWSTVIDIDLSGTFYSCQAAFPHLGRGSSVVTIASIAAYRGMAQRAAYCAAKAGVVSLTRTLGVEWAEHGIRVNAVAPGWVDTPFLREAAANGHVDLAVLAQRPPMKRLVGVDDVVGAVRFLIGPEAGMVTGQTLCIDGGWTFAG